MGCIARLGCLLLLIVLAACAWLTRGMWLPDRYRSHAGTSATTTSWQPITAPGADRARVALDELNVQGLTVQGLSIPSAMIPTLIKQISRDRPAGVSENALPLPIPRSVGDIRVANGKVTLYKSLQ